MLGPKLLGQVAELARLRVLLDQVMDQVMDLVLQSEDRARDLLSGRARQCVWPRPFSVSVRLIYLVTGPDLNVAKPTFTRGYVSLESCNL